MDRIIKGKIKDITNNFYKYLLNLQNVNAIGVGWKWVNRIKTPEPCINVFVDNKIKNNYLPSNNIIPKMYMGIKTDVIETGIMKASSNDLFSDDFKSRPLEGGCGIGCLGVEVDGSLGCIVTKIVEGQKQFFILSNNHVIAGLNKMPMGTPIIQPAFPEKEENIVARLSNFIGINFLEDNPESENLVDAAVARINNASWVSNRIIGLGEIKGVGEIIEDTFVKKVGLATGITKGQILAIETTNKARFKNDKSAIFKNQIILILPNASGDSGAVVVNNNEVLGLIFSGSEAKNIVIMNNINNVLKMLNVQLYIG